MLVAYWCCSCLPAVQCLLVELLTCITCLSFLPCLSDGPASTALTYIAHALDALLFCFLPLVFALLLRIVTGRDLMARLGKRTLVREGEEDGKGERERERGM